MPDQKKSQPTQRRPRGFTPQTGGLTSEYAREQGWDINEEQRAQTPREKQPYDGGRDYDYGARDFGDTAIDTSGATDTGNVRQERSGKPQESGKNKGVARNP